MNDFDVVTGPSPGIAAAKIAPPEPARELPKDGVKRGGAAPAAPPSSPSDAGEKR
jgi:hypothetical protein